MAVESTIFSPRQALSLIQLREIAKASGLCVCLIGPTGEVLAEMNDGPLQGDFVLLRWPESEAEVTRAIDNAIASRSRTPIDELGRAGQVSWCSFTVAPFNYDNQWIYPEEKEEYEDAVGGDHLKLVRECRTRYALRSGVRPSHCARMVDEFADLIQKSVQGIRE